MITCYFGVPRVGKNTFLTMIAQREIRLMKKGKSRYAHIYCDFYCEGTEYFRYSDFKKYKAYNSLFLLGEMGMDADGRNFKNFSKEERDFFILHGHIHCDIIYATQEYSDVDAKIRRLTEDLWYLTKSCVPFLRNFTTARRIFRTVAINDMTSELVVGYRFPNLPEKLFSRVCQRCYRPLYYKYFDSYEEQNLKPRELMYNLPWNIAQKMTDKDILDYINKKEGMSGLPSA